MNNQTLYNYYFYISLYNNNENLHLSKYFNSPRRIQSKNGDNMLQRKIKKSQKYTFTYFTAHTRTHAHMHACACTHINRNTFRMYASIQARQQEMVVRLAGWGTILYTLKKLMMNKWIVIKLLRNNQVNIHFNLNKIESYTVYCECHTLSLTF